MESGCRKQEPVGELLIILYKNKHLLKMQRIFDDIMQSYYDSEPNF
jgi:hypothetical protein